MLKTISALVVIGTAAYTYVLKPAEMELGVDKAKCWWDGGVYIEASATESGYVEAMSRNPENKGRIMTGQAKGCMPEAKCVMAPSEALSAIDRRIIGWGLVHEGNLLKATLAKKLHDGKGFDLPVGGEADAIAAQARMEEASYCMGYLETVRGTLVKALKNEKTR